jgi:hypothetical protein
MEDTGIYASVLMKEKQPQKKMLSKRFYQLDDIVDKCVSDDKLMYNDMNHRLITLYQTYVNEWDTVKSQIMEDFLEQ